MQCLLLELEINSKQRNNGNVGPCGLFGKLNLVWSIH